MPCKASGQPIKWGPRILFLMTADNDAFEEHDTLLKKLQQLLDKVKRPGTRDLGNHRDPGNQAIPGIQGARNQSLSLKRREAKKSTTTWTC